MARPLPRVPVLLSCTCFRGQSAEYSLQFGGRKWVPPSPLRSTPSTEVAVTAMAEMAGKKILVALAFH